MHHHANTEDDLSPVVQATVLLALLQPAPETYELFDDILLLSEGVHPMLAVSLQISSILLCSLPFSHPVCTLRRSMVWHKR